MKYIWKLSKNQKRWLIAISVSILTIVVFSTCGNVNAFNDGDVINILQKYPLQMNNPAIYILRALGWVFVCGLIAIVDGVSNTISEIFDKFSEFYNSPEIINFMNTFLKPVYLGILSLSILYIGFRIIVGTDEEFGNKVIKNLIISIIVTIGLTTLMDMGTNITRLSLNAFKENTPSLGSEIVKNSITDVKKYDADNFSGKLDFTNDIRPENITKVNAAEVISNTSDVAHKEVFQKYLVYKSNGDFELDEIKPPTLGGDIMSSWYYRFNIDFFQIFVCLLVAFFALLFSSIKVAKLLYELAINQMIAHVLAFVDLHDGQRLKKCLQTILATFITVIGVVFMMKIYIAGMNVVSGMSPFAKIICMMALSWALIEGPNLFEQIVGVDAGLQSGVRALFAANQAMGLLAKGGKLLKGATTVPFKGASAAMHKISSAIGTHQGANAARRSMGKRTPEQWIGTGLKHVGNALNKIGRMEIGGSYPPSHEASEYNNESPDSPLAVLNKDNMPDVAPPNDTIYRHGINDIEDKSNIPVSGIPSVDLPSTEDVISQEQQDLEKLHKDRDKNRLRATPHNGRSVQGNRRNYSLSYQNAYFKKQQQITKKEIKNTKKSLRSHKEFLNNFNEK